MGSVILHPGFHKTGTTTLQHALKRNRAALSGRLAVLLPEDMPEAAHAARRAALGPDARRLERFRAAFAAACAALPADSPALISCEDLCGMRPGRRGARGYDAAVPLLSAALDVLAARGHRAPTVWLTVRRDRGAWLRSLYWQALRGSRLIEDFETFAARLAPSADPVAEAGRIGAVLGTRAALRVTDAADCPGPFGTFGAMLAALGICTGGLAPPVPQNVRPADGIDRLLALNHSEIDEDALAAAKRAYLDAIPANRRRRAQRTPR